MLDLNRAAVLDWLKDKEPDKPDLLEPAVRPAEDKPGVEQSLVRMGAAFAAAAERDPQLLATRLTRGPAHDDLRLLLGQLGAPRCLRLIHWLMTAGLPDADAVLAAVLSPDETGTGQFVQATLAHAVRSPLVERIFSPGRLAELLAVCPSPATLKEAA